MPEFQRTLRFTPESAADGVHTSVGASPLPLRCAVEGVTGRSEQVVCSAAARSPPWTRTTELFLSGALVRLLAAGAPWPWRPSWPTGVSSRWGSRVESPEP
jgi:hypothetical protein